VEENNMSPEESRRRTCVVEDYWVYEEGLNTLPTWDHAMHELKVAAGEGGEAWDTAWTLWSALKTAYLARRRDV